MLLDEPYRALDSLTKSVMHEALLEIYLQSRVSIFFITHDLEEAIFLGHRVVIMTTRPCRPKKILDIDIPHPRDYERVDDEAVSRIYGRRRLLRFTKRQSRPSLSVKRNADDVRSPLRSPRLVIRSPPLSSVEDFWRGLVAILAFLIFWEVGSRRATTGSGFAFPWVSQTRRRALSSWS